VESNTCDEYGYTAIADATIFVDVLPEFFSPSSDYTGALGSRVCPLQSLQAATIVGKCYGLSICGALDGDEVWETGEMTFKMVLKMVKLCRDEDLLRNLSL
jgi:hypothetical protein